ncbi:hypothetical protein EDC24_0686 [Aquisalibacillus elongatus]|uniref:Uncharacterized protein n=1 Tax=Aquisalibacillus elongatus TaxID=485577 RepID=A0A3N5C8E6_9BACI|nr:hypothetical protein EDC24_0686 [Aquisalibacillus elongatus]
MNNSNNKVYLLEALERLEVELEHLRKRMQLVNPDLKKKS